jgi:L-galactose dehydrogenase
MTYRIIGKTGLKVSVIGYGTSPLRAEFGAIDPAEGKMAVDYAIDNGINYFDAAPYYGRTMAEKRLGEFLEGKRQNIILTSKACRYDITTFDFSARRVSLSIEESLKRLRTDYLDIYHIHNVEYCERKRIINETIPVMQKLKKQGKILFVGITGYPLTNLKISEVCTLRTRGLPQNIS